MVTARLVILLLVAWKAPTGQPVVAPTPENAGAPKGQTIGGYNVANSLELGYRFRTAGGNTGKCRSDVGFSHVQDAGDGRLAASGGTGAVLEAFLAAQTFPLTFRSPMGRLSVRLHENVRWNFGYQYYGYGEEFSTRQNYRAHTGYTSVLWSF